MKAKRIDFTDRYDDLLEVDFQNARCGKYKGERVLYLECCSPRNHPVVLTLDQARELRDFLVTNL